MQGTGGRLEINFIKLGYLFADFSQLIADHSHHRFLLKLCRQHYKPQLQTQKLTAGDASHTQGHRFATRA